MQNSRSQTIHAPRIFPLHLEIPLHLLIARFHVRQPNTERITTRVQAGAGATRQPKAHLTRSANHLQIYFSFVERPCTPYFISVEQGIYHLSRNSRSRTRGARACDKKRRGGGGGGQGGGRKWWSQVFRVVDPRRFGRAVSEMWQECWPRVCLFPLCCRWNGVRQQRGTGRPSRTK